MTKSELIARLAEANPHLYHRDIERIVTTIFDEITAALAEGDRVELRGFGAFPSRSAARGSGAIRAPVIRSTCRPNTFPISRPASSCARS